MGAPGRTGLIILILLATIAWGGSWTAGKMIAGMAPPEVLIFWRFFITFLSFIPIMMVRKDSMRLHRKSLLQVVFGAVFLVSYNKFFFWGLEYGLAGAGGVLVPTLNPLLTFLLAIVLFRHRLTLLEGVGVVMGLSGGLIMLEIWGISVQKLLMSGNLFFLVASVSWASVSLISEKSKLYLPPLVYSFYVFGLASLLDLFIALPYDIWAPLRFDHVFWLNLGYLSLFATTFATTVYFYSARRLGSHKASSYIFMVPVSAVLIAWVCLGEVPLVSVIVGGVVTISAVYLINAKTRLKEATEVSPNP
jgi:drug/metabolite transporter (DMT)-like permease